MSLVARLSEKFPLREVEDCSGLYFYGVETPAHQFRHYVFEKEDNIFVISQRDFFDSEAVCSLYKMGGDLNSGVCGGLKVVSPIFLDGYQFDSFVLLGSDYHDMYKGGIPGMHSKTIVAFPCHHSEVVGDESEKTIKLIRNKVVSTVNWKRDIAPRIYFWFRNEGLGIGTPGGAPSLADYKFVKNTIVQICSDGGDAKIVNYKGEQCAVKSDKNDCQLIMPGAIIFNLSVDDILDYVYSFLIS